MKNLRNYTAPHISVQEYVTTPILAISDQELNFEFDPDAETENPLNAD